MTGARGAAAIGLVQVERSTFRAQIADQLRQAIIGGTLAPGSAVTEMELANRFGVSRGPLREAMSQLAEEGLLVSVPYTGTRFANVMIADVREIYSLRTALESLAFRQVWAHRDGAFRREMAKRHRVLQQSLAATDRVISTAAEVHLHSLVYEACGHRLLLETWRRIAGRLQLYLALHQKAHGRTGPLADAHDRYVALAIGDSLDAMLDEVEHHMKRGIERLETFVA
jgi:DNA-binding GntR family transcriptional regulator